uniref:Uncharacterized protein n=1 Tax=Anguilla anguilla TaxID=7936 RepID=A0A0E9UIE9_ANGAN
MLYRVARQEDRAN